MRGRRFLLVTLVWSLALGATTHATDIDGVQEHPLLVRYPGQEIRWQQIENFLPFRVPVGAVTGYRRIDDWIDVAGRVTRTFYRYAGTERGYSELYLNYLEALKAEDFEILGQGLSPDRRGADVGSRSWSEVYFIANPTTRPGEVNTFFAGTASSGGAGTIVARKERAAGTVYVVIGVEQHAADYVGALVDIIEVEAAETGLVAIDAEAIGADLEEYGRVVLDGLVFDFDKATLRAESDPALKAIAEFLAANPDKTFYVVGHTDAMGTFDYNTRLSSDRAAAVVQTLQSRFGIDRARLEPHGVGPLSPVYANTQEAGKQKNRRVELVER
ncbi:MAG: OmpA family protein [Halioglobus sp.]